MPVVGGTKVPLIMTIPEVFSRSSEIVGTAGFRTDIRAFSIVVMTRLMPGWDTLNRSGRASSIWTCLKHRRVTFRAWIKVGKLCDTQTSGTVRRRPFPPVYVWSVVGTLRYHPS